MPSELELLRRLSLAASTSQSPSTAPPLSPAPPELRPPPSPRRDRAALLLLSASPRVPRPRQGPSPGPQCPPGSSPCAAALRCRRRPPRTAVLRRRAYAPALHPASAR